MTFSLFVTWIAMVMGTAAILADSHNTALAAVLLGTVGAIGFMSNILLFGVDQLQEASSQALSSYVHWWVWSIYLGATVLGLFCFVSKETVIVWLVSTAFLTFVITVHYLWPSAWLYSEPKNATAYTLIYEVLTYARKHKHPVGHSSLIWGEASSRICLGKSKYGGPFREEEVEDVRYFLQLLVLQCVLLIGNFDSSILLESSLSCRGKPTIDNHILAYFVTGGVVLIPLYIIFLRPIVWKCLPNMLNRFKIGLTIHLLKVSSQLLIDMFGHYVSDVPVYCILPSPLHDTTSSDDEHEIRNINPYFAIIPAALSALTFLTIFITAVEFTLAQAPHNMRGILLALDYSFLWGLPVIVSSIGLLAISILYPDTSFTRHFSCISAYTSVNILFTIISIVLYFIVDMKYKYRERGSIEIQTACKRHK